MRCRYSQQISEHILRDLPCQQTGMVVLHSEPSKQCRADGFADCSWRMGAVRRHCLGNTRTTQAKKNNDRHFNVDVAKLAALETVSDVRDEAGIEWIRSGRAPRSQA